MTSTGATGTGAFVFATSPTFVTPTLGVATATSLNGISSTTLGYVDPTSSIQTQLNAKPTAALVTTVGSPGVDTNVVSEKAIRTALAAITPTRSA